MRSESEVLRQIARWARANQLVRAILLTGSRANPAHETDSLSDYDIALFVSNLEPFRESDRWLSAFGQIRLRWPQKPRSTFDNAWITRLVLYDDDVRIDFQITEQTSLDAHAFYEGYRIVVDKDGRTSRLDPPTFAKFFVREPTGAQYDTFIREFWWDASYVPKYLRRDEFPFAARMMCRAVRDKYLHRIIEWYIGLHHDWSVTTGQGGRWFRRYLDEETYAAYLSTFAGPDPEQQWQAFFSAVNLFGRLARVIGDKLGYTYPESLDEEMNSYYRRIRTMGSEDATEE